MGDPSAATPFAVTFMTLPETAMVTVLLFGAGPGSYFDFETLSSQVPALGSVWAYGTTSHASTARSAKRVRRTLTALIRPPSGAHASTSSPRLSTNGRPFVLSNRPLAHLFQAAADVSLDKTPDLPCPALRCHAVSGHNPCVHDQVMTGGVP